MSGCQWSRKPLASHEPKLKHRETKNDLQSNAKTVSIGLLNARVANCIDLALLTKQAHWNLKGRQFVGMHGMLDGFRMQVDGYVYMMASGPEVLAARWAMPSNRRDSAHRANNFERWSKDEWSWG